MRSCSRAAAAALGRWLPSLQGWSAHPPSAGSADSSQLSLTCWWSPSADGSCLPSGGSPPPMTGLRPNLGQLSRALPALLGLAEAQLASLPHRCDRSYMAKNLDGVKPSEASRWQHYEWNGPHRAHPVLCGSGSHPASGKRPQQTQDFNVLSNIIFEEVFVNREGSVSLYTVKIV